MQCQPFYSPEAFATLPNLAQRVAIARDVIAQLDARLIKSSPGTYLSTEMPAVIGEDMRELLLEKASPDRPCKCCGIGALFVGMVRLNNHVAIDEDYTDYLRQVGCGREAITNRLCDYFAAGLIDDIEDCFEWNLIHLPAEQRMRIIMQYIIDNDGEFDKYAVSKANPRSTVSIPDDAPF
jgi:hypothetical protein